MVDGDSGGFELVAVPGAILETDDLVLDIGGIGRQSVQHRLCAARRQSGNDVKYPQRPDSLSASFPNSIELYKLGHQLNSRRCHVDFTISLASVHVTRPRMRQ
jgi:hypothetical protein